ncbi:hypothetical protein [Streptomyces mobaraensis]|uniref:hypothetical protein n=1 Tax=Streptomyces mobaraensis TaxID=35621 RepID=UPI0033F9771A
MYPTRDECGICDRYRSAVNGAMGRAQWARVQGFQDEADAVRRETADYRKGWREHLAQVPHRPA